MIADSKWFHGPVMPIPLCAQHILQEEVLLSPTKAMMCRQASGVRKKAHRPSDLTAFESQGMQHIVGRMQRQAKQWRANKPFSSVKQLGFFRCLRATGTCTGVLLSYITILPPAISYSRMRFQGGLQSVTPPEFISSCPFPWASFLRPQRSYRWEVGCPRPTPHSLSPHETLAGHWSMNSSSCPRGPRGSARRSCPRLCT